MRGAYLEVMGDLVRLRRAVIVAALVIAATGLVAGRRRSPRSSIGVLILPRTWTLLKDAVDVLLEATPKGIDLGDVRRAHPRGTRGRRRPRPPRLDDHLGDERRLGARRARGRRQPADVLDYLCGCLSGDFDIEHSTFQLESSDRSRLEAAHHA